MAKEILCKNGKGHTDVKFFQTLKSQTPNPETPNLNPPLQTL